MSESPPLKFSPLVWSTLILGLLRLLGILAYATDLVTSRLPSYIYASVLWVRIPLEVALGMLALRGAWKFARGQSDRLLMIASSASLGYALFGLLVAWGHT